MSLFGLSAVAYVTVLLSVTNSPWSQAQVPQSSGVSNSVSSPCTAPWVAYGGNCYRVFNSSLRSDQKRWTNAEQKCQLEGGYLANIGGQAENDFVSTLLLASGLREKPVAIGLREENVRSTIGVWRWTPSKLLVESLFTQWAGGDAMRDGYCGFIVVGNSPRQSVWKSFYCGYTANYICERGCGNTVAQTTDPNLSISGQTSALGDTVNYRCPPKYFLQGRSSRTCASDSLWTFREPVCIDSSDCPDGWVTFDSNCYRTFNISRSWDDAQDVCVEKGGYLVNIGSAAENLFLGRFLDTRLLQNQKMWFGLSEERVYSSNGDWRWRPRGQKPGYTAWAQAEPHNLYPWDCAALLLYSEDPATLQWYDYRCDERHAFVCERGCHELGDDGTVQQSGSSTGVNATIRYECASGYEVIGQTSIVCQVGGHWDATSFPRCEPARGARTLCNDTHMEVAVGKFDVAGFTPSAIHLLDSGCTFQQNNSHFFTTTRLDGGCNTSHAVQLNQVVYSNRILSSTGSVNISVQCLVKTLVNVTLAAALEKRDPITFTAEPGIDVYDVRLAAYNSTSFKFQYVQSAFPTPVFTTDRLFLSASVKTTNSWVSGVRASECWAAPGDQNAQPQVVFLNSGCPSVAAETLLYNVGDAEQYSNFSVAIGGRIGDAFATTLFYVHCAVRVCHVSDVASLCKKTCSAGTSKRAVDSAKREAHVYLGPFQLRRGAGSSGTSDGQAATRSRSVSPTVGGSIAAVVAMIAIIIIGAVLYRRQQARGRRTMLAARRSSSGAMLIIRNNLDSDSIWEDGNSDLDMDLRRKDSDALSTHTMASFVECEVNRVQSPSTWSDRNLEDVF